MPLAECFQGASGLAGRLITKLPSNRTIARPSGKMGRGNTSF